MKPKNLNGFEYYMTGTVRWDNGRTMPVECYRPDFIDCPAEERHGHEVEQDDPARMRFKLPPELPSYTITWKTCRKER